MCIRDSYYTIRIQYIRHQFTDPGCTAQEISSDTVQVPLLLASRQSSAAALQSRDFVLPESTSSLSGKILPEFCTLHTVKHNVCCILISGFSYVENLLHFNLADF